MREVDVAIVGGGVVGATLALLLVAQARVSAARVLVVEPRVPAAPRSGSPIGLRVSSISPVNRERLARLGAWRHLEAARIAPIARMSVWHAAVPPDSPDVLHFDAAEYGSAELGCMVENNALQAALLTECAAQGIEVLAASLQSLHVDAAGAHLQLSGQALTAQLAVGADGAASAVRGLLQLPVVEDDYQARAIVATVDIERDHQDTAWQRFLATGPLALLPLPGRQCSIVWSAAQSRASELLGLSADEFSAALTIASAGVLGRLRLAGERADFALRRLAAQRYVAPHVALVGDAAHVIHPLAGQGVNQGMEDAAALAAQLNLRPPRESLGALAALRRYERERRAGNALMGGVVDGLDRLFSRSGPLVSWAAREGMALVARSGPARRFFVRQAAGSRSSPRR
jgi:ubiquinone biosynthesis UbiH/UbiF/VisC/COQ6 family hydroxylase